ncbi:alanine dehydrogenase, partial [Bacteroides thetaiotaomicron]
MFFYFLNQTKNFPKYQATLKISHIQEETDMIIGVPKEIKNNENRVA